MSLHLKDLFINYNRPKKLHFSIRLTLCEVITYEDLNFATAGCSRLIKSLEPDQLLQKFGFPLSIMTLSQLVKIKSNGVIKVHK
jgi:hypothetical protein